MSFSSTTNIRDFKSLSGGQKSVVSMAFIFAILMMDRAPFYLLDEADMVQKTPNIIVIILAELVDFCWLTL